MTVKTANFPSTVWDGITNFRQNRRLVKGPDHEDWDEMLAELLAVETSLAGLAADTTIWVAPWGVAATAIGSMTNPYATIAAAIAAITSAKKTIVLLPGIYAPTAILVLPVDQNDCHIVGVSGSHNTIITGAELDQIMSITPGAQGAPFEITIQGVTLNQFAAKKGIFIDDTSADDTITVTLQDVTINKDASGDSIDLLHAVDIAVTLSINHCTIDGAVQLDVACDTDQFFFDQSTLVSIVSDAGTATGSFIFRHCTLFTGCLTGGHVNQTVTALYCHSIAAVLASTTEFTGNHTETLIAPTS